jgi:preprotein translocase subunit SecG
MKDGQNRTAPATAKDTVGAEEVDMGPSGGEEQFLVTAQHGRNLRHSTITLAVLFTVGALCVWFMIKKVTPPSAEAAVGTEEAKIVNAIAQLTGIRTEMDARMGDIVARFNEFSNVEQISVADLKKNPFELEVSTGDLEQTLEFGHQLQLRKEVEEKAQALQLWSIMASPQNACCMINNKILYKGDKIDGFTVMEIDSRFVKVELHGIGVILRMPE